MEKVKTIKVESTDIIHEIYCDDCGTFLGQSRECEDGWYEDLGIYQLNFWVTNWYRFRKNLCNECRKKFIDKLDVTLTQLGFTQD